MKRTIITLLFLVIFGCTKLEPFDYMESSDTTGLISLHEKYSKEFDYKWLQKTTLSKNDFSITFFELIEKTSQSLKMTGLMPGGLTIYEYYRENGIVRKNHFTKPLKKFNKRRILDNLSSLYLEAFKFNFPKDVPLMKFEKTNKSYIGWKDKNRTIISEFDSVKGCMLKKTIYRKKKKYQEIEYESFLDNSNRIPQSIRIHDFYTDIDIRINIKEIKYANHSGSF